MSDVCCFLPPLKVLNYMDKMDRLHDNYLLMKKYHRTLTALEEYVKWINKEEKLLNLASTTYPDIKVIREFIVPFMELMGLAMSSQQNLEFIYGSFSVGTVLNGKGSTTYGWMGRLSI